MDSSYSYHFCKYSFLQVYQKNIEKKLQEIDLFLKITPEQLNIENTSALLDISVEEIKDLMSNIILILLIPVLFLSLWLQEAVISVDSLGVKCKKDIKKFIQKRILPISIRLILIKLSRL